MNIDLIGALAIIALLALWFALDVRKAARDEERAKAKTRHPSNYVNREMVKAHDAHWNRYGR